MARIKIDTKIDMTNINRMVKDLNRLETTEIDYGYSNDDHSPDDELTNSELGYLMEYGIKNADGSWHSPPRPAMHRSSDIFIMTSGKESQKVVTDTLKGNAVLVNKSLEKLGDVAVESLQESIDRQGFRKLSPTTIRIKRAKNSKFPTSQLLDSGGLYESVTYEIK